MGGDRKTTGGSVALASMLVLTLVLTAGPAVASSPVGSRSREELAGPAVASSSVGSRSREELAGPAVASSSVGSRSREEFSDAGALHSRWIGGGRRLALGPGSGVGDGRAPVGHGRASGGEGAAPGSVSAAEGELRTGLGVGLGVAGAASLGLGVGLLVQHRRAYAHFEGAPDNAGFVAALTTTEVGAGWVGAGLGLAVSAVSEGLGLGDRGRWAELVAGGGVALLGIAWYAREWQQVQRDLYEAGSKADGYDAGALHREAAAAAVLGAGVGLAVGAGVALLTRWLRGSRAKRTAARWGMVGNRGGLGLGGRF
jgi:hypothetical protein